MNKVFAILFAEIPDISERWRIVERISLIGFAIIFPLTFVLLLPGAWLGFGLGDEFTVEQVQAMVSLWYGEYPLLANILLGVLVIHLLFRTWILALGHWRVSHAGSELPLKTLVLFTTANTLNIIFVVVTMALIGAIGVTQGYTFQQGFELVQNLVVWSNQQIEQVPTLVQLPLLVAFILVYQLQGFFHYWIHRLCHHNRVLWLVLHRFHHMPPILVGMTTTVVIASIPAFLVLVVPKVFIFGTISKLFYERPLYAEIFAYHIVMWIPEIFGHQTKMYQDGIRSRFIRWSSYLGGNGVYHYLHHASSPYNQNKTNNVNIAGGFLMLWDRLFNTYQPLVPTAPKVGLWGNPELTHSPVKLVLSGIMQVLYELWHNQSWRVRWRCIFGHVSYTPPITKDFHVK
jgi:sterol desaturase/sphingolipid hydroxylase (fatty acid hydroxylase superfamily)